MAAVAITRPITNLFRKTTTELAATMSPGLVPGEAYLTGTQGEKEVAHAGAGPSEEQELDALQAQIDARRATKS
jgi:hypothetical protein